MEFPAHNEEIESNIRLIIKYQGILIRQLEGAYKAGKLDEITFQKLKSVNSTAQTRQEIYDHFDQIFRKLVEYYQEKLRERIRKGAELLDSIGKDHEKYQQYMALYDELCEELSRSEEGRN